MAGQTGGNLPKEKRKAATGQSPEASIVQPIVEGASCSRLAYAGLLEDERTATVKAFLESHSCHIPHLAPDFVLAAELNGLDYRLLPVLAVLETGCGRATKNNNLFGWANGRKPFASLSQGIHFVAQRLRLAPHYAGKTISQKLRVYNRRTWYRRKVLAMMETMTPEPAAERPVAATTPSAAAGGLE